jgi:biopolymer transport protein ExbB/TolQ
MSMFTRETNQSLRDIQMKYQQFQLQSKESHLKYGRIVFVIILNSLSLYRTQNDLESSREQVRIEQEELSHLRQKLSQVEQIRTQIQNEFEQKKQQCRQLEHQISDKDESKKNVDLVVDQYRQQLTNEKELRISK